jgi:hypothetical protein
LTGPLRVLFSWPALFTCASLFLLGCSAYKAAPKDNKPDLQGPSLENQNRFPADLLNSLQVIVDASPVFLEPKKNAPTFGPLTRGEVVKWLDARDGWIRVWIPRLLISGWVLESGVEEIQDANPNLPPLPKEELTTVFVLWEKVNVREGPSTKSEVFLIAGKDQEFFLLGEREGWCQVWVPEKKTRGWIFGKGLARKSEK